MFPTSLLLPSLAVFLVSRSDSKRQLRSKDLGFLVCSSVWILLFFSLASCKLPTYILPAIPLICLMTGGMLDLTVFSPQLPSRITRYLKPFPQRACMILVFACAAVVFADVWLSGGMELASVLAIVCCGGIAVITLLCWNRDIAFSFQGWCFSAFVAVSVLGFTSGRFIPIAAMDRSVYARTARLIQQKPDATLVFFGERTHGLTLELPAEDVSYFAEGCEAEFVSYISHHQETVVVMGEEKLLAMRQAISETHEIISASDHEHLYLARPIGSSDVQTASLMSCEHH